jgi:short-subunit dehydrogenase
MSEAQTFQSKYGPWALVTGAAQGLGAEFARQIAARGINLVIIDMLTDELVQVGKEIRNGTGREIITIATDLSEPQFIDIIRENTDGLDIGLLVNNAAFGPVGLFLDKNQDDKLRMVAVNVQATLILVHEFASKMVARKSGGIILLSSASALQGSAYVANYAATKAYNLILAEGLWEELREQGVDVLGFMPGITRTPAFEQSNPKLERIKLAPIMEAGPTVTEALEALGKGPSYIAGRRNRLNMFLSGKLLPRKSAVKLVGKQMRDLYG